MNVYHIQQIGRTSINHGDYIVQGRDGFHDDIDLARVVGANGNSDRTKSLEFVFLQVLTAPVDMPATDWREIMEQQESIAADNIAWTR